MLEDLQEELADIRAEDDVLQRHMYFVGWITALAAVVMLVMAAMSFWTPRFKPSATAAMGAYMPVFAAWCMLCQKSRVLSNRTTAVHDRIIARCEALRLWTALKEASDENHAR